MAKQASPGETDPAGRPDDEAVVIVPAVAEDAAAAGEITREAFDGVSIDQAMEKLAGPAAMGWQDLKADEVRREIRLSPEDCFVARLGGRVVGYVTTHCDKLLLRGQIPNLAVDARHRGKGIGRKLLQRALEHFRQAGMKQARIETLTTNPIGQHLYPAVGFQEAARQIHYVMRLD